MCPNDPAPWHAPASTSAQGRAAEPLRALCVSIHDVCPATWPACQRLWAAVREVADIPLTWLVVPRMHGSPSRNLACEAVLDAVQGRGHELALHGYLHLDDALPDASAKGRFLRGVYTRHEGEFAALGLDEARRRIELGLGWFRQRGWYPSGFVPPAWLLGSESWQALREYPFAYITTYTRLHLLPGPRAPTCESLLSPSLVYTSRNRVGRLLSPAAASLLAVALRPAPLVRLALHPADAAHPALLRHAQTLLRGLLSYRQPMTKAAVAARFGARVTTDPRIRPSTKDAVRSCHKTPDRSAGYRPWH